MEKTMVFPEVTVAGRVPGAIAGTEEGLVKVAGRVPDGSGGGSEAMPPGMAANAQRIFWSLLNAINLAPSTGTAAPVETMSGGDRRIHCRSSSRTASCCPWLAMEA